MVVLATSPTRCVRRAPQLSGSVAEGAAVAANWLMLTGAAAWLEEAMVLVVVAVKDAV